MKSRAVHLLAVGATLLGGSAVSASGHGPVFGMTTPTNAAGGWSVDFGLMGRRGEQTQGSTFRTMISHGWTEDLQLSGSIPAVFSAPTLPPVRMTGMMPGGGDFEGLVAWRFHRQGTNVGTRFESTAYGGVLVPGPQKPAGLAGTFPWAPGVYVGVATGVASRSHYVWGGAGYTSFVERQGDRRPAVFTYSVVWGYRPPRWRHEYPRWDWRVFAELNGDKSSTIRHNDVAMAGTAAHQVFIGPTVLGIYKQYAIEGGVQWPMYRDLGNKVKRETLRYAVNFARFF